MHALLVNKLTRKIWLLLLLNQFSIQFAYSSDSLWTNTYGLEFDDQGRHILPTEDGGYIFLGVLVNAESNSEDMWLVKLDSKGDMIWQEIYGGSLSDRGSRVPIHYYLSQNYPNPFNPATTINYGMLKTGNVKVNIYDILGNNVKELVNRKLNEGHHQVIWNGTNKQNELVSSGIYYYQIVTEDFQDIKKMIFVR